MTADGWVRRWYDSLCQTWSESCKIQVILREGLKGGVKIIKGERKQTSQKHGGQSFIFHHTSKVVQKENYNTLWLRKKKLIHLHWYFISPLSLRPINWQWMKPSYQVTIMSSFLRVWRRITFVPKSATLLLVSTFPTIAMPDATHSWLQW